jgi:hypothetical protein
MSSMGDAVGSTLYNKLLPYLEISLDSVIDASWSWDPVL